MHRDLSPSEVSQNVIYYANLCEIYSALIIRHCLTRLRLHYIISDEMHEMDFVC